MSQPERCERCDVAIIRNADQPKLCASCAPPSAAAVAVHKALAALHAKRGTVSDLPALRCAIR